MGQGEVISFLKKCEKPKTRRQIAEGMDENPIKISKWLNRLVKYKEVLFIEHDQNKAKELVDYPLSRRTRFFYV